MRFWLCALLLGLAGCITLPTSVKHKTYEFPEEAFVQKVTRPHETLGLVRSKVNYSSAETNPEETDLCSNYYNKAVRDLVQMAKKKGADAVIDVRSIVFFEAGGSELYTTAECADDGMDGQILTQGTAVKWKQEVN
jgi:hypothetical protein